MAPAQLCALRRPGLARGVRLALGLRAAGHRGAQEAVQQGVVRSEARVLEKVEVKPVQGTERPLST